MLNKIKLALRISHNCLNSEILDCMEEARAEMIRSGISSNKIHNEKDLLVSRAIKTYCLYYFENDEKKKDGFWKSWEYQLDCLRKSTGYRKEGGSDV